MAVALTATGKDRRGVLFLRWGFFFWGTIGGATPLFSVAPACKIALRGMGGGRQLLIGLGVLAAFGAGFVALLNRMSKDISPAYTVMLVSLVAINVGWIPALKRMRARGRQAAVRIEGFRTFLG